MENLRDKQLKIAEKLIEVSGLLAVVITFLFQILSSPPYNVTQSIFVIHGFGIVFSIFIIGAVIYYFLIMFEIENKNLVRFFSIYVSLGFSSLFAILFQISFGDLIASLAYLVVFSILLYLGLTGNLPLRRKKEVKIEEQERKEKINMKKNSTGKNNYKIKETVYLIAAFIIFFYIFLLLDKPYFSPFPKLIIFLIFLSSIFAIDYLIRIREEKRDRIVLGFFTGFILAILTLQAAWPIFTPKISLSDVMFTFGRITTDNGYRKDYNTGIVEVKIKPPLIPLFNSIRIPLALTNLTRVWYEEIISPPLFSHEINNSEDSASFYVYADGWTYEELKIKIGYEGDRLKQFKTYLPDTTLNPPSLYELIINNKSIFETNFYFQNYENFKVCLDDYQFILKNISYSIIRNEPPLSVFNAQLCDSWNMTSGECRPIYYSTDGKNFSYLMKHEDFNYENLTFKIYGYLCLENNITLSKYLIFNEYP